MSWGDDGEPSMRWSAIVDFYADLAGHPGWEYVAPMVDFARWAASRPSAVVLYPYTSHQWLCVALRAGYRPDEPFVAAGVRPDGLFQCELWGRVGHRRHSRVCPITAAPDVFESSIIRLGLDA